MTEIEIATGIVIEKGIGTEIGADDPRSIHVLLAAVEPAGAEVVKVDGLVAHVVEESWTRKL